MTNKQSWEEDTRRIITGQYPDLFDIPKNGQSVWLEKEYMNSLLDLIEKIISSLLSRQAQEIEKAVERMNKTRYWVGQEVIPEDETTYGKKEIEIYNLALSDAFLAIKQTVNK